MKIIVDSNGLAYRSLYTFGELSHKNSPTGVIYGFLSEVLSLAKKFDTNQFAFCWDSRQSYRKMIDPEYKAGRGGATQEEQIIIKEAHNQFDLLRQEILPAMGFKRVYIQSGYESDDLMADIVFRTPDEYIVATGDDDILQLLKDDKKCPVKIYNLSKKKVITEEDFTKQYGIKPRDWATVKAMGGCNSDNVKGIPGVGKESAIKYMNDVLKDGAIKNKIESEIGKQITIDCMELVHLPFVGDREIEIIKDRDEFYKDEIFHSLDFIDTFRKYGCGSFSSEEGFGHWRKAFKLIPGR